MQYTVQKIGSKVRLLDYGQLDTEWDYGYLPAKIAEGCAQAKYEHMRAICREMN